jgi:hypothetical protein
MNRHAVAKALAKKGLNLFRIRTNDKKPFADGWQSEAKPDAKAWTNGRDYNIGVATGAGVVVIDIDMKKGVDGEANWEALGFEESPFQIKTPSGGRHLYYKTAAPISNSASKIADGVDVRGQGGYVVGPGSQTEDGVYTVLHKAGAKMAAMPEELVRLCGEKRQSDEQRDTPACELDLEHNVESAEAYLARAEESVEGAGGDHNAFAVAARVRELGVSEEVCLDLMLGGWNERCAPPWSGEELSVKVKNAYAYANGRSGSDTAEADFADDDDSELQPSIKYNAKSFADFLQGATKDDGPAIIDAFINTEFGGKSATLQAEKAVAKVLGLGQNINAFRYDVAAARKRNGGSHPKRLSASEEDVLADGRWPLEEPLPPERFPYNNDGKLLGHEANYDFMLKAYGIEFAYDMISKMLLWASNGLDTETDNAELALFSRIKSLAALNGLPSGNDALHVFLPAIAETKQVNRVRDYLKELKWDGNDRFKKLAASIGSHDKNVARISIERWFIQACAAADGADLARENDPTKKPVYEYVLVMCSGQGDGKTKGLVDITPKALRPYLKESVVLNTNNKDIVKQAVSCWIAELGELDATFKAADHIAFKAFMSRATDELRMPYAAKSSHFRRRAVFFGSVNDPAFLKDKTGSRRFYPLSVDRGFPAWPDAEVDQLWAQAWSLYAEGEQWWPTTEEAVLLGVNAEMFREKSWVEECLEENYKWDDPPSNKQRQTASAILRNLKNQSAGSLDTREVADVGHALRRLWTENGAYKNDGVLVIDTKRGAVKVHADGGNPGWLLPPFDASSVKDFPDD